MASAMIPARHGKILNLQMLRLIAALGVLLSHAADLTLPRPTSFWLFPWTSGVDVFFVISGIIMTVLTDGRFGQAGAARHFLVRRIIRIAPIYWLFTALMIFTVLLLPGRVQYSQADAASVVSSLTFFPHTRGDGQVVPILGQGWTLNHEAFFYAAFALALLFRRGLAALAAVLVLLVLLHTAIPPVFVTAYFWSEPVTIEFVAGIGLGKLWLNGLRLRPSAVAFLVVASLLLFAAAAPLGLAQHGRAIGRGIPATMLCAAFLFAAQPGAPGPIRRALIAGGDASYALYLSHTFTINAVILLLGGRLVGWVTMAIAVALAIFVSLLVHRLVERPMLHSLRHRPSPATH